MLVPSKHEYFFRLCAGNIQENASWVGMMLEKSNISHAFEHLQPDIWQKKCAPCGPSKQSPLHNPHHNVNQFFRNEQ